MKFCHSRLPGDEQPSRIGLRTPGALLLQG